MLLHNNCTYCIWIAHLLHNIKEKGAWKEKEARDLFIMVWWKEDASDVYFKERIENA